MSGLAETMIESKDIDSSISMASPTFNPHGGKRGIGLTVIERPEMWRCLAPSFHGSHRCWTRWRGGRGQGRASIDWGERSIGLHPALCCASWDGKHPWTNMGCAILSVHWYTHPLKKLSPFSESRFQRPGACRFCSGAGETFNE